MSSNCTANGGEIIFDDIILYGDLILCGSAVIRSCVGIDIQIIPGAGGITRLGGEVTSHALVSDGDLVVERLEVNSDCFFDDNARWANNKNAAWGATGNCSISYNTIDVPDTMKIGVPSSSNSTLLCQQGDKNLNFAFAFQTDPTFCIQSADATQPTQRVYFKHNQTDAFEGIGTGGRVTLHDAPVSLADDASFDLPDSSAGWGFIIAGDSEEYAHFVWDSTAVVTLVANSANVVAADVDTNLCIFDNGTAVRIRNRLGAAKSIMFDYHYTIP